MSKFKRYELQQTVACVRTGWRGAWDAFCAAWTRKPRCTVARPITISVYADAPVALAMQQAEITGPELREGLWLRATVPGRYFSFVSPTVIDPSCPTTLLAQAPYSYRMKLGEVTATHAEYQSFIRWGKDSSEQVFSEKKCARISDILYEINGGHLVVEPQ